MKNKIIALILCFTICLCGLPATVLARNTSFEETLAMDLKNLGLFYGVSDTDFALNRAPTRIEAMIMLIRLLGKEEEATSKKWSHPFQDVPDWASHYVGYAYEQGLTKGTSETTFGTENANAQMYLTFILRALGYSDVNQQDFHWENPYELSEHIGILPSKVDRNNFLRADVVLVSYAAMKVNLKNSSQSLAQKLISEGVFTQEQFENSYDMNAFSYHPTVSLEELTAEQVYDLCSSSVFYLEVYDKNGDMFASGSGFFIDESGIAVTNYHVIEGAYSAKIQTDDESVYDVKGIYDYNADQDWAVIQIDGSGFKKLEIGDPATITGGATVFAIGSPLGLQNTISQGLISNANRLIDGVPYIQTSAAISHGSSGGALINKYAQVIGITSAGFTDGENLGLALPISLIEGFNDTSLRSLAKIVSDTSEPIQETPSYPSFTPSYENTDAYSLLAAFIEVYATDTTDEGDKIYEERNYSDNGYSDLGLIHYDDYIMVYIWSIGNRGSTIFTSFTIDPYQQGTYIFYIWDYYSKVEGNAYYSPASIRPGMNFRFTEYSNYSDPSVDETLCINSVFLGLTFVNSIFAKYLSSFGYYNVRDLGFINY